MSKGPPVAKKVSHEMELFGDIRVDNYYWLRDDSRSNPDILSYLNEENAYTHSSVQTLSDPKVIDRIKMELFGVTSITRKIILEGEVVVVDGLSGDGAVGSSSGAAVEANDAPLTVFKTNHYAYDHTGYTDFVSPRECSACKYQDCRKNMM
ncbi:hypothetical protein T459_24074 [Capsicum annuum]|uniref:Peptidase S9A N-terminal domain-containing protein n=1 Tax=Capsicum annuum TaxID=4072 RepID=A0A2G2YU77_CAPAN|nr:hypothetical protein T459_24074 [Capsicum annuum]